MNLNSRTGARHDSREQESKSQENKSFKYYKKRHQALTQWERLISCKVDSLLWLFHHKRKALILGFWGPFLFLLTLALQHSGTDGVSHVNCTNSHRQSPRCSRRACPATRCRWWGNCAAQTGCGGRGSQHRACSTARRRPPRLPQTSATCKTSVYVRLDTLTDMKCYYIEFSSTGK